MLFKLAHYFSHRMLKRGDIRLAMTVLVKDEADIIEDNIRVHAKHGIDCFAVMDNGSIDGTREILDKLSSEFDLHIIDKPDQNYQQSRWMTELAFYARDKLQADWVISNDADEFWIPTKNNLKYKLDRKGSIITYHRYNMLLKEESLKHGYRYFDSTLRVKNPIFYDKNAQLNQSDISILLAKISPKVMVNPYGLLKIKGGNHRAKHVMGLINKKKTEDIKVYHYPVRSYEHFMRNIKNRQKLLKKGDTKMGDHYRRWVKIYEAGGLEEEFKKFLLTPNDIQVLIKYGVVEEDNLAKRRIMEVLGTSTIL